MHLAQGPLCPSHCSSTPTPTPDRCLSSGLLPVSASLRSASVGCSAECCTCLTSFPLGPPQKPWRQQHYLHTHSPLQKATLSAVLLPSQEQKQNPPNSFSPPSFPICSVIPGIAVTYHSKFCLTTGPLHVKCCLPVHPSSPFSTLPELTIPSPL